MSHPATIDPRGMLRGAATGAELDAHAANATAHGAVVIPAGGALVGAVAQALAQGAPVIWSSPALFDPDGYFSVGTPNRLTVPVGKGGRLFIATAQLEANDAGTYRITFSVNGAIALLGDNGADYAHATSAVLLLADGDYVQVGLAKNGGGASTTITADMPSRFGLAPQ